MRSLLLREIAADRHSDASTKEKNHNVQGYMLSFIKWIYFFLNTMYNCNEIVPGKIVIEEKPWYMFLWDIL